MTEVSPSDGARLRLARQARGLSQQQLAGVAGVTRQAVSAVESGHSDPSLRVALGLARALGMTVEELFGPGALGDPVLAQPVATPGGLGSRVALATVGDRFVALPLHADTAARLGFGPAGGLVKHAGETAELHVPAHELADRGLQHGSSIPGGYDCAGSCLPAGRHAVGTPARGRLCFGLVAASGQAGIPAGGGVAWGLAAMRPGRWRGIVGVTAGSPSSRRREGHRRVQEQRRK